MINATAHKDIPVFFILSERVWLNELDIINLEKPFPFFSQPVFMLD